MSLATASSPFDATLVAPTGSQAANPTGATPPDVLTGRRSLDMEVASFMLRPPVSSFRKRTVPDRRQLQAKQYAEDERAGILDQARALADRAPTSALAWARFAQALASAGDGDEAVDAATRALGLSPRADTEPEMSDLMARFIAARVLAAAGDDAHAEAALADVPPGGPWTVLYAALAEQRGEHRQALARLDEASTAEACAFRGFLLLQVGEPEKALTQLRSAQRSGATGAALSLNMAYAYAMVGSPGKAVRAARQAVTAAPHSRHASFNLASYLRASGHFDDAVRELQRLQTVTGDGDAAVASALASAYLAWDRPREALRELRRAQHHSDFGKKSRHHAELVANTSLLEWKLGEKDTATVLAGIRGHLQTVGPHLPLALMLADVSGRDDVLPELIHLRRRLEATLPEDELAPLSIRVLLLQGRLDEACSEAMSYAAAHPLDVEAVRGAIILQAQISGDYGAAAAIGLRALRRMPADPMLINNVAYCLALAGRGHEAAALLHGQSRTNPFLVATRGLVAFALGHVIEGLQRYDEAARLIDESAATVEDATSFTQLLRSYEYLALHELGLISDPALGSIHLPVPKDWPNEPRFHVLRRVAKRLHQGTSAT